MMDAKAGTPQGGQKLTDEEIVINAFLFLLAGYETTANTLAYTSYLLALHPSVQDRLHSEIEEYFENNPVSVHAHAHTHLSCSVLFFDCCETIMWPRSGSKRHWAHVPPW